MPATPSTIMVAWAVCSPILLDGRSYCIAPIEQLRGLPNLEWSIQIVWPAHNRRVSGAIRDPHF